MGYNIVTWNMQGSGEKLAQQLNFILLNCFDSDLINIFCLQEFGSPAALDQLVALTKNSKHLVAHSLTYNKNQSLSEIFINYKLNDCEYEFKLIVAWYNAAKNMRCGTAIMYELTGETATAQTYIEHESIGFRPVVSLYSDNICVHSVHAIANQSQSVTQVRNFCEELSKNAIWNDKPIIIGGDFNQTPESAHRLGNAAGNNILEYPLTLSNSNSGEAYIIRSNTETQGPNGTRVTELDFFIVNRNLIANLSDPATNQVNLSIYSESSVLTEDGKTYRYSDHDPVILKF